MYRVFLIITFILSSAAALADTVLDSLRSIYYEVTPAGSAYIVNQGVVTTVFGADGKPVFPFKYRTISQGLAGNYVADEKMLINGKGELISLLNYRIHSIDRERGIYKLISDDQKYYEICDASGKVLVPANDTERYNKGMLGGPYPYKTVVDTFGHVILNISDGNLSIGKCVYSCLRQDTAYVYGRDGKLRFSFRADAVQILPNDILAVQLYGLWALKDSAGKTLTEYKYCRFEYLPRMNVFESCNSLITTDGREVIKGKDGSNMHHGRWMTIGYHGDIIDDKLQVVFKEGSYSTSSFEGNRYVTLSFEKGKYYEKKTYDLVQRKFVPFYIEEQVDSNIFIVSDDKTARRTLIRDGNIVSGVHITKAERISNSTYYKVTDVQHTGSYVADLFDRSKQIEVTKDLQGLLDSDLKVIVPVKYTSIELINRMYVLARLQYDTQDATTLFDTRGKKILSLAGRVQFARQGDVLHLYNNDTSVLISSTGLLYCGRQRVSMLFAHDKRRSIAGLPQLLAINDSLERTGIYDITGHMLLPHLYHIVAEKVKGVVSLKKDDSVYFADYRGRMLFHGRGFEGRSCYLLECMAALMRGSGGRWGVIDANNIIIIPFIYDTVYRNEQANGYVMRTDGKYYRLDNTAGVTPAAAPGEPEQTLDETVARRVRELAITNRSTFVVPAQWDKLPPGIYNANGRKLIPGVEILKLYEYSVGENYNRVIAFTNTAQKRLAVIDTAGRFVVPFIKTPQLLVMNRFAFVALYQDAPDTLFSFEGEEVTRTWVQVDAAQKRELLKEGRGSLLVNNTALICTAPGVNKGLILGGGRSILEPGIDSIYKQNDLYYVRKQGRLGLVADYKGWVCPPVCDSIVYRGSGLELYNGDKQGIYNARDGHLIKPVYDTIINAHTGGSNYILVQREGKYLYIDRNERALTPLYDSISSANTDEWHVPMIYAVMAARDGKTYRLSVTDNGITEREQ